MLPAFHVGTYRRLPAGWIANSVHACGTGVERTIRPPLSVSAQTESRSRLVVTYSVRESGDSTAPSGSPSIAMEPVRRRQARSTTATSFVNWLVTHARSPEGATITRVGAI